MKLTQEQKDILIEYAEWYDSMQGSAEELVEEFEQDRIKQKPIITDSFKPKYQSFTIEI
jgi:hypothetical protein